MRGPGILFFIIIIVIMLVVTVLFSKMLDYICIVKYRNFIRKICLVLNGMSMAGLFVGKWLLSDWAFAGVLLRLLSMWFMLQVLMIGIVFLIVFLRFACRKLKGTNVSIDKERRRMLKHAVVFPVAAMGVTAYGSFYESDHIEDTQNGIYIEGMDSSMEDYCIAQLSDVHLGYFFSVKKLRDILDRIAAKKPDVLVVTGDLFDDRSQNDTAAKLLDTYTDKFPQGIYFCRGNHEHMRGIEAIEAALQKTAVHELVNKNVILKEGCPALYLAGVEYPMEREEHESLCRRYTAEALQEVPKNSITVLLAHHPDFIDNGIDHNVNLILTGHTHGGQFGLFGIPLIPMFKYMRGMYKNGRSYGYVNRGAGSWFPIRFGCPPEIAYFTLRKK
jgi:hypothetical protein